MNLPKDRVAVKICGVTNADDAWLAVEAGVDFLGFNTWSGTKRFISLETNAEWIAELPVQRVALFVNATMAEVKRVAALPFIDALQFHGDEDADFCQSAALLGKPIIKALRIAGPNPISNAVDFKAQHILLDAHVAGAYGGTGNRVDLEAARRFRDENPELTLWLAGGLKPENVAEAIVAVRPRVVDVSSGVEGESPRKDAAKMRDFVAAARGAWRK